MPFPASAPDHGPAVLPQRLRTDDDRNRIQVTDAPLSAAAPSRPISVGLNAAIIAIRDLTPVTLEVDLPLVGRAPEPTPGGLPFGPFDPVQHRTLEAGLRAWVTRQTGLKLGYVEQLYTFGDRGRRLEADAGNTHEVSIGYLALTHLRQETEDGSGRHLASLGGRWCSWYSYFPWEDWRSGRPRLLDEVMLPALEDWARHAGDDSSKALGPRDRLRLSFGLDGAIWDEERVLERYELLYEAGLVLERYRDNGEDAQATQSPLLGQPMQMDHRRILATAISRLRSKLKYRPVVFELMSDSFTLTELQTTVEAISGRHVHKQNFRRLVEQGQLVEPTGAAHTSTGGRPAKLFRFRRSVLAERPAPGLRLGSTNG